MSSIRQSDQRKVMAVLLSLQAGIIEQRSTEVHHVSLMCSACVGR